MLSRRQFIKAAAIIGAAGIAADGLLYEPGRIAVEKRNIGIKNLPPAFDGFRICQITDVHHGQFAGIGYLEKIVALANSLSPDITVLTGDYVFESSRYIVPAITALCGLKAAHGLMAVLGNHDHYHGAELTREVFDKYGVPVLDNGRAVIEKGEGALCIGGVGDLLEDMQDLKAAFGGIPSDVPRILLSHNPDYAELMPKTERVDLIISGHTHGGQIRLPFSFAPVTASEYGQKYAGGLVRLPHTQVYVSRGLGEVGIPVRFNCRPEIAVLTLTGAESVG